MEMPLFGNFFGQICAYSHYLYPAPVKLSTQFLQPAQLADTVGSPVCPEKLDEDQMTVKAV